MEIQCFHGNITKEHCEEILTKKGKNGSFLIRNSESIPGVLCLCVLWQQGLLPIQLPSEDGLHALFYYEKMIYTYRIFRKHNGHFMIQASESMPKQDFRTLKDIITTYRKPNQGLVINLRYPVNSSTDHQGYNAYVSEDEDYMNTENGGSIFVFVLPPKMELLIWNSKADTIDCGRLARKSQYMDCKGTKTFFLFIF